MRRLVKLSEVVASAERENDSQEHSQWNEQKQKLLKTDKNFKNHTVYTKVKDVNIYEVFDSFPPFWKC